MTRWMSDQLDKVGRAEEVQIASVGRDGTLRKPVTVWVVRHGEDLYVRSVKGRSGHWFRGIQERHEGRIRAGPCSARPHIRRRRPKSGWSAARELSSRSR
jgi:hypothetical protein